MYHLREIKKGELGKWSKVIEEYEEYQDAKAQGAVIMQMVELSDLYGAIEAYTDHNKIPDKDIHNPIHRNLMLRAITLREPRDSVDIKLILNAIYKEARSLRITMADVILMSDITKRAFQSGDRV